MTGQDSRTILFLQGPPTTFWTELADAFLAVGHRVERVNLNGGDMVFWPRRGAVNYRGSRSNWSGWLADFCRRRGVTDILYYADRLPYHVDAKAVAGELGIRAYAVEFGYLRPDWLTLERGGMGAYSHFPADPDVIRSIAKTLPPPPAQDSYTYPFAAEAFHEVTYSLSMEFLRVLYPGFRSDRYYHPYFDYLVWLKRLGSRKRAAEHAAAAVDELRQSGAEYHLVALQLQSDYQIRANSPYWHIREMIDQTVASFARRGNPAGRLVFKQHPLDNGWENWPKVVRQTALRHGIADRVMTIDGGDLASLLQGSRGAVVINSTVGLHAIQMGVPTKILGIAVFDMPGLTHQGSLDSFWTDPEPVDGALAQDLVRVMAATIQVKGSFYNPAGRAVAAGEIVRRVVDGTVNQPGAFVDPPPRLETARRLRVPVRV